MIVLRLFIPLFFICPVLAHAEDVGQSPMDFMIWERTHRDAIRANPEYRIETHVSNSDDVDHRYENYQARPDTYDGGDSSNYAPARTRHTHSAASSQNRHSKQATKASNKKSCDTNLAGNWKSSKGYGFSFADSNGMTATVTSLPNSAAESIAKANGVDKDTLQTLIEGGAVKFNAAISCQKNGKLAVHLSGAAKGYLQITRTGAGIRLSGTIGEGTNAVKFNDSFSQAAR